MTEKATRPLRVLCVDDEAPIRLMVRVNLEAHGMEVLEAADGEVGLEVARTERPDLVLLDIMMPGLDGYSVFTALRADEATRDVPVIFLTARAEARDQLRAMQMGALDYITKPFDPNQLPFTVKDSLARLERREGEQMRTERIAEIQDLIAET